MGNKLRGPVFTCSSPQSWFTSCRSLGTPEGGSLKGELRAALILPLRPGPSLVLRQQSSFEPPLSRRLPRVDEDEGVG